MPVEYEEVESCKDRYNANIHGQPFPESVSEEESEIHTHNDGCHRHRVKYASRIEVWAVHGWQNITLGREAGCRRYPVEWP